MEEKYSKFKTNNNSVIDKKSVDSFYVKYVKRILDIIISLLVLIVLSPLYLILFLGIKIEDPKSPVLFKQLRAGKNNIPFYIYKFRSMVENAPKNIPTKDFIDSDIYITKIGKFMRKTSLDELPQIFNILKGDMSFVGFRPVILEEVELNKLREKENANKVLPGITGLAQINGRDEVGIEEKVEYDKYYCENISAKLDIKIFIKTIPVVLMSLGNKDK